MRSKLAFIALLIVSIMLIVCGFSGTMGVLLACFLVPSQVKMDNGNNGN